MLLYCWARVADDGPTVQQHWVIVSCLLGMLSTSKEHASHPPQHPANVPVTHSVAYDDRFIIETFFECWSIPYEFSSMSLYESLVPIMLIYENIVLIYKDDQMFDQIHRITATAYSKREKFFKHLINDGSALQLTRQH